MQSLRKAILAAIAELSKHETDNVELRAQVEGVLRALRRLYETVSK